MDDEWSLATSVNRYVVNILQDTEIIKNFFDDDVEELFISTSVELVNAIKEQTLNVEEELLQFKEQNGPFVAGSFGYQCALQQVALEFMKTLRIYPLGIEFPERSGVYCIYYVGETQLYEGSQVSHSTSWPVYVGMSEEDIADRLKEHCRKVSEGKTAAGKPLKLSDFVVRFMIVDDPYSAPYIKGHLIEYFSPVWNKETMGFCFGNASSDSNIWNKFYIQNKKETIKRMLGKLRIRSKSLESICSTDEDSSVVSTVVITP